MSAHKIYVSMHNVLWLPAAAFAAGSHRHKDRTLPQQLPQVDHLQVGLQEPPAAEPVDQGDLVILRRIPHLSKKTAHMVEHHAAAHLQPDGQEAPELPDQLGPVVTGEAVECIKVHRRFAFVRYTYQVYGVGKEYVRPAALGGISFLSW